MTIVTKFNKGNTVYFMRNNAIAVGYISFIEISSGNVIGLPDPYIEYALASSPSECLNDLGKFHESKLFITKDALVSSL